MLRLNAGISRKVGEPNYSSRGASVNLELEVESHVAADPDALMDRLRRLFRMARDAVDRELESPNDTRSANERGAHEADFRRNGEGRPATESQLRAIRAIARDQGVDPDAASGDIFGASLAELTLQQASQLIDQLKQRTGSTVSR